MSRNILRITRKDRRTLQRACLSGRVTAWNDWRTQNACLPAVSPWIYVQTSRGSNVGSYFVVSDQLWMPHAVRRVRWAKTRSTRRHLEQLSLDEKKGGCEGASLRFCHSGRVGGAHTWGLQHSLHVPAKVLERTSS